jgi:predicted XRE-type DNA-binding protein
MKTRLVNGVEVHRSSGNVFADLGLADAEKLKIKSGLVIEIIKAMKSLSLTQQEAAKWMGISQPKLSDMIRGDFTNLSERKLMDYLTRLGYLELFDAWQGESQTRPPQLNLETRKSFN